MDKLRNKILSNTAINFAGKGLTYLIQMVIIAYLLNKLGKEGYGIIVLAIGLVSNINLVESGFGLSVTKYIAEYNVKNEWDKINEIISANALLIILQAIFCVAVLLGFSHFFLIKIFNIPAQFQIISIEVIDIFILMAFLNFLSVGLIRIAEGFQWYKIVRQLEVQRDLLRAGLIFLFLILKPSLINVAVAYSLSSAIFLVFLWFKIIKKENRIKIGFKFINFDTIKQMSRFSFKIFVSKIYSFLSYRSDIFLIGHFLDTTALSYYQIAYKIYELVKYVFMLISSTMIPVASELNSLKSREKLTRLFEKVSKYTIIVTYPIIIILFVRTEMFIKLWVGGGFGESILLSRLFLISLFPTALIACGSEIMVGLDKLAPLLKFNGIATAVNVTISFILVQKIGAAGVIWGTVFGSSIIACLYLNYILNYFELPIMGFLKRVLFKTALFSILLFALIKISPNPLIILFSIIIYAITSFIFLIDINDKNFIYGYIRR